MAIKTTWKEVNQIIKEEFQRLMEKKKIQNRLQQINEELAVMEEEDSSLLDEVEVSGTEKVRSHAWTGEEGGDEKFKPKFEKIGTHLKEDEEIVDDMEIGDFEEESDEESEGESEELNLSDEFAELGAAIEAKIMAALGKSENSSDEEEIEIDADEFGTGEDEEFEEVEIGEEGEEEGTETEEGSETEEEEIDEYNEVVPTEDGGTTTTHEMDKKPMNESKENKSKFLNVLSEGLNANQKNALTSEMERMRKLAKLDNEE